MDSNFLVESLAKKKAQEASQAAEADNAEKQFTIDQVSTIVQSLGTATAIE